MYIVNVKLFHQYNPAGIKLFVYNCIGKKFILSILFQITEDDYICEPCNELLMRSINQQLTTSCDGAQASGSSQLGRRQVCSICGRSTLNRKSHAIVIDNPSEEQRQINAVIQTRIAPRQVPIYVSILFIIIFLLDKNDHNCQ